jgi:hypothetical protein
MAENESVERARKELEKDRELTQRSREEYAERMKGKPTPTQEENDLAACGAHITEHEDDGSGPDPFDWSKARERQLQGGKPGAYQTRSMSGTAQPRPATPPRPPST